MALRLRKKVPSNIQQMINSSFNDTYDGYGYGPPTPKVKKEKPIKPIKAKRTFWQQDGLGNGYTNVTPYRKTVSEEDQANLVSSLTHDGKHLPAIDLDLPARLSPSSTPGHFHLYIEKEMEWAKYEHLLQTLYEVGIIEKDFLECSIRDKMTFLRTDPDKHPPDYLKELDSEQLINKVNAIIEEVRGVVNVHIGGETQMGINVMKNIDKVLHTATKLIKEAL